MEILENAAPLATGNYQKLKAEILVEWKAHQCLCGEKLARVGG